MTQTRHGYTIIPGSAELRSSKDVAEQLLALEGRKDAFHDVVRGEELYSCSAAGFPDSVFTHLLPTQKPLEQLVYLHLLQRALQGGRNFCRVSRSQLATGCQLSPRRLGTALAGLVDHDHVVAGILQLNDGVGTNVTYAARYQNLHCRYSHSQLICACCGVPERPPGPSPLDLRFFTSFTACASARLP